MKEAVRKGIWGVHTGGLEEERNVNNNSGARAPTGPARD